MPSYRKGEKVEEVILQELRESSKLKEEMAKRLIKEIKEAAEIVIGCYKKGGKVILFGNGGSAADAQHIAAELVGRFKKERKALSSIALTTNTSILTALGNDYDFKIIFARQVEALADKKDVVIGISTSGNSLNVVEGVKAAKEIGVKTIGLTGLRGGKLRRVVDLILCVPSLDTARIQEGHITIGHIICRLVEEKLFGG
ncbi:MAG: phosphoheptose isomerase [Armatimonadetes bacterium CG07_land_8_20_14_0_80_40_9]|nr:MAG: phosphoheptose isomerase [Armatimonadetes bacterium CG07_land_8_20_14_0_80_40_9]